MPGKVHIVDGVWALWGLAALEAIIVGRIIIATIPVVVTIGGFEFAAMAFNQN